MMRPETPETPSMNAAMPAFNQPEVGIQSSSVDAMPLFYLLPRSRGEKRNKSALSLPLSERQSPGTKRTSELFNSVWSNPMELLEFDLANPG